MHLKEHAGVKIRKIRKENKDTLKELSDKIDFDYSNLSKAERGLYGVSLDLIESISEVYGVSPSYFFEEDFTDAEGRLLVEDDLTSSSLKQKYEFNIDGIEATDEEIKEAIRLIRLLRDNKSL